MKTITDGSAVFTVRDKRMSAMVDMFYPVGSVYISADKSKTKADFPIMQYGTWEEVPANLCLQTGAVSEAGTQRSAGLPNITGGAYIRSVQDNNVLANYNIGAITCISNTSPFKWHSYIKLVAGDAFLDSFNFDASKSNPIYGSSDTVQPPSYMVRAWVRTA